MKNLEEVASVLVQKDDSGNDVPNRNYNSRGFLESYDFLGELEKADVRTRDGLEKYFTLTKDPERDASLKRTNEKKGSILEGVNEEFTLYAVEHLESLFKELGEEERLKIALSYIPEKDSEQVSTGYNLTKRKIAEAETVLEKIREGPDQFFEEDMSGQPEFLRKYFTKHKQTFLELSAREAEENRILAVSHFGPDKFVSTSRKIMAKQEEKVMQGKMALDEAISRAEEERLGEASRRMNRVMTAREYASAMAVEQKKFEDGIKKLEEENPDAKMTDELDRAVFGGALASIRQKLADAA